MVGVIHDYVKGSGTFVFFQVAGLAPDESDGSVLDSIGNSAKGSIYPTEAATTSRKIRRITRWPGYSREVVDFNLPAQELGCPTEYGCYFHTSEAPHRTKLEVPSSLHQLESQLDASSQT
jgi:hypothetical protein